jgi:hypothetical protein
MAMSFARIEVMGGHDEIFDECRSDHRSAPEKLCCPVFGNEPITASQERREECAAAAYRTRRWHSLDRLLSVSFGMISPPYTFGNFPPFH